MERMTIVTPLPSGVMSAENTTMISMAARQCVRQTVAGTMPAAERTLMIIGTRKAMPVETVRPKTVAIKASREKKGVTPSGTANE